MCYLCMGAVSCVLRRILSVFAYLFSNSRELLLRLLSTNARRPSRSYSAAAWATNEPKAGKWKCVHAITRSRRNVNEKSIFTLGRDLMLTHPCRAITKGVRAQWAANEEKKLGLDSVIWISFYLQAFPRGPPVFILNHDGPKRRENWNRFEKVSS